VQDFNIAALQSKLREEGAVFEYNMDEYNKAFAAIRKRFAPPARKGPIPWGRPSEKK
jgi:hypothetical protein